MGIFKKQPKVSPAQRDEMDRQKEEIKLQRQFIKEKFYPFLLEKGLTVEQTLQALQTLAVGIKQSYNNMMKDFMVFDLDLKDKVAPGKEFEFFRELLTLVDHQSVMNANSILENTAQAINTWINQAAYKKPLKEIKSMEEVIKDLGL
jgi:hypothetical protein